MAHQHDYHKRITERYVWKMALDELRHFRVGGTVLLRAAWAERTHPKADHIKPLLGALPFTDTL